MRSVYTFTTTAVALLTISAAIARPTETIHALDGEWNVLADVTGYRSIIDKEHDVEIRLLESNGAATVALNPIGLYIVIVNHSPNEEVEARVWRLPKSVARVRSVKTVNSGVEIIALVESSADSSRREMREVRIMASFTLQQGRLSDTLRFERD